MSQCLVARAARDVGVRVGFAVSMKDHNPLVYGPSEPILAALAPETRVEIEQRFLLKAPSPTEHVKLVDDVAAAAGGSWFNVQYGPQGDAVVAVRNGHFAVTNAGDGVLMEPGASADMILLDWAAIDGCFLPYRRSKRSSRLTTFRSTLLLTSSARSSGSCYRSRDDDPNWKGA